MFAAFKHLFPLPWLVRWAWHTPSGRRDREAERWSVACVWRLSRLMGAQDRDCLQRSLLLYRVLSRSGADPMLVVGFRHIDGGTQGHAWVIADGHPVIEDEADLLQFSPALCFGLRGALLRSPPATLSLASQARLQAGQ
jgi:hypothetical protein